MNGRRWILLGAALIAPVVFGACGASEPRAMNAARAADEPTTVVSTSVVTSNSTVTRTATHTSTRSGADARHASVQTQGGTVEVAAAGAALEVLQLTAATGWTSSVDDSDPTRLVVTFTSAAATGTGSVEVDIRLTATGITSSTTEHISNSSG